MAEQGGLPRFLTGTAVASTAWTASLIPHLRFHDYPLFTEEVGLLLLAGAPITLLGGAAMLLRSRGVEIAFAFLLAFLLVDWHTTSLFPAPIAAILAGLATWRWRLKFLSFASIVLAVVTILSLLGMGERRPDRTVWEREGKAEADSSLPLVVHVLFDEFEGIDGMSRMAAAPTLADTISRDLTKGGFTVYRRAFSRHPYSSKAIPALMNGGRQDGPTLDQGAGGRLDSPLLLETYADKGYHLSIFDTVYLGVCDRSRDDYCDTHWQNSLRVLRGTDFSAMDRARLILLRGARSMISAVAASTVWDEKLRSVDDRPISLLRRWELNGLNGLAALDRVEQRLRSAEPGDAIFAHVLFPHYPYNVSADCELRSFVSWSVPWSSTPIDDRQRRYAAQAKCAILRIERLAAMARERAGENFVIIVHGDHGSRIGERPDDIAIKEYPAQSVHAYSTMLAVRHAGQQYGSVEPQPVEIGRELSALTREIGAHATATSNAP